MTAPQINEKLKEKIKEAIDCIEIPNEKGGYDSFNSVSKNSCSVLLDEIMSLIPQPEQLEVYIRQYLDGSEFYVNCCETTLPIKGFLTEKEAIDFCNKFNFKLCRHKVTGSIRDNLKVVNEEGR